MLLPKAQGFDGGRGVDPVIVAGQELLDVVRVDVDDEEIDEVEAVESVVDVVVAVVAVVLVVVVGIPEVTSP